MKKRVSEVIRLNKKYGIADIKVYTNIYDWFHLPYLLRYSEKEKRNLYYEGFAFVSRYPLTIHISPYTSLETLYHELGHVYGEPDEDLAMEVGKKIVSLWRKREKT